LEHLSNEFRINIAVVGSSGEHEDGLIHNPKSFACTLNFIADI
jgi:hypothetical protein